MQSATLVGVTGLRQNQDGDEVEWRYPWDESYLEMAGVHARSTIEFHPEINAQILTPAWFDASARNLLERVKGEWKPNQGPLIFFGESLGGIILKTALGLAAKTIEYSVIPANTCACVLSNVPCAVASQEEWTHILTGLALPFWSLIPKSFWLSTASTHQFLSKTSSEFVNFARCCEVITLFHPDDVSGAETVNPAPRALVALGLSHERLGAHSSQHCGILPHDAQLDGGKVKMIFGKLERAAQLSHRLRKYMGRLSRLCRTTWIPHLEDTWHNLEVYTGTTQNTDQPVQLFLTDSETRDSELLYSIYKRLLFQRDWSDNVAYFQFTSSDRRQQTASAMLLSIIQQLLACEPGLVSVVEEFENDKPPDSGTATAAVEVTHDKSSNGSASGHDFGDPAGEIFRVEGSLWRLLQSMLRMSKSTSIHLIISSLNECSVDNINALLGKLLDLLPVVPVPFRIYCSADSGSNIAQRATIRYVEVAAMPQFQTARSEYAQSLTSRLVSQNPELDIAKAEIKEYLETSAGLLHASLCAHSIHTKLVDAPISEKAIRHGISLLGTTLETTVRYMITNSPSWVSLVLKWLLCAHRPLTCPELAVALALDKQSTYTYRL